MGCGACSRHVWLCIGLWLIFGGCRKPSPQNPAAASPAAPATQSSQQSLSQAKPIAGPLVLVPQKLLRGESYTDAGEPLRFSAELPLVAEQSKEGCDLFSLQEGVYLGQVPVKECADWRSSCETPFDRSHRRTLQVNGTTLTIAAIEPGAAPLRIEPKPPRCAEDLGATGPGCQAIAAARFSPDGKMVAFFCQDDSLIHVHDAASGAGVTTLDLGPKVALSELCWGPGGLLALANPRLEFTACGCSLEALPDGQPGEGRDYLKGPDCQAAHDALKRQASPPQGMSMSASGAEVVLRSGTDGGTPHVFRPGSKEHPCEKVVRARVSPDGDRVFIQCNVKRFDDEEVHYIGVVKDGSLAAYPVRGAHRPSDAAEAGFYRGRLVMLDKLQGPSDFLSCDVGKPNKFATNTYLYSSLTAAPKTQEYGDTVPGQDFIPDPFARFLFMPFHRERAGHAMSVQDLVSGTQNPLSWGPVGVYSAAETGLWPSRWLPGKYPVWETVEEFSAPGFSSYTAIRIYTAPRIHGIARVPLKQEPRGVFRVEADGRTVVAAGDAEPDRDPRIPRDGGAADGSSPDGRFTGTDSHSLQRKSDGEELIFADDGAVRTARGVFDGPIELLDALVFRSGEDPQRSPIVHGDQLARLLFHPHLLHDFFDGKPVVPAAYAQPLGLPPALELIGVRTSAAPGRDAGAAGAGQVLFTVVGKDSGDGVASVQRFLEGKAYGEPVPISAGVPAEIEIPFPTTACTMARLYACNRLGYVCSRPIARDLCPPGQTRPEKTER